MWLSPSSIEDDRLVVVSLLLVAVLVVADCASECTWLSIEDDMLVVVRVVASLLFYVVSIVIVKV